jgi:hypothetical protein
LGYRDVPIEHLNPAELAKSHKWLERCGDGPHFFKFPRELLLPLREELFLGKMVHVPANPVVFSQFEYGMVLDVPLFPFAFMFYTHASCASQILTLISASLSWDWGKILSVVLAMFGLKGGFKAVSLIVTSLSCLGGSGKFRRVVGVVAIASLVSDIAPLILQSIDVVWDTFNLSGTNVNQSRVLTLCIPGGRGCFDF